MKSAKTLSLAAVLTATKTAQGRRLRTPVLATIAFTILMLGTIATQPAQAGCGCDKAPPDAATVRPNAAWAGEELSIFEPSLVVGMLYAVDFNSGTTNASAQVKAFAVNRRDLADGIFRVQLNVALPDLPLGPTEISVTSVGGNIGVSEDSMFTLDDSALTVTPAPVALATELGSFTETNYQAAVGRDGTVYISLDLSAVKEARTVRAQALGYPMVFTVDDAVFYNTQGFLMQLLNSKMPGLSSVESLNTATDSDALLYARHEFNTFYVQHDEKKVHGVDPTDPNWHLDGSPHIDHDHQILAIGADLYGGASPVPGATPPFDLSIEIGTLFERSMFAQSQLKIEGGSLSATFDPTAGTYGQEGLFQTNGIATVKDSSFVGGVVRGSKASQGGASTVVGGVEETSEVVDLMPVELPDFLTELGDVKLDGNETLSIGPGSYHATLIDLKQDAVLDIDNTAGSVTIYVTGDVKVANNAAISASDIRTEKLSIYVLGPRLVTFNGSAYLYGTIYAPEAIVTIDGVADTFGSFVGKNITIKSDAAFYQDELLVAPSTPSVVLADSCTNSCGGMSMTGSCYCDSLCANFGDCCTDYTDICSF